MCGTLTCLLYLLQLPLTAFLCVFFWSCIGKSRHALHFEISHHVSSNVHNTVPVFITRKHFSHSRNKTFSSIWHESDGAPVKLKAFFEVSAKPQPMFLCLSGDKCNADNNSLSVSILPAHCQTCPTSVTFWECSIKHNLWKKAFAVEQQAGGARNALTSLFSWSFSITNLPPYGHQECHVRQTQTSSSAGYTLNPGDKKGSSWTSGLFSL